MEQTILNRIPIMELLTTICIRQLTMKTGPKGLFTTPKTTELR